MEKVELRKVIFLVVLATVFLNLPFLDNPRAFAYLPGGTLNPTEITKYAAPLIIPPAMPRTKSIRHGGKQVDYYEIAVRQFQQQILPPGLPLTIVWSYGSVNHPGTFNYPAFTIEAKVNRPVRVKWINDLKDSNGNYLPHFLAVDQTLHWANPPGGEMGTDMEGTDQLPYTGPVPMVVHVHGAHVGPESDGYAEAWYLPAANNIPAGYATAGSFYGIFKTAAESKFGQAWEPGTSVFQYPNDQRASTIWYHDHSVGMTRLNVYAGPAGFFLIRGGSSDLKKGILPGPAPARNDPKGKRYYEIPIVVQDRSFNSDGSLFYPDKRAFFEGLEEDQLQIPFKPSPAIGGPSDVPPIWNPEFFGNTMVVNGRTWPYLNVEPRRYRFRFLNGCNARFVILKMVNDPLVARPATAALSFWQIGAEGGFLPAPAQLNQLLMSPAERADVIVDFSSLPVGTEIYLINEAPDEPFGGGEPGTDFSPSDPGITGQVMKFVVVPLKGRDRTKVPAELILPNLVRPGSEVRTRKVSLNEEESETVFFSVDGSGNIVFDPAGIPFGPTAAKLGILDAAGNPVRLRWSDTITENPTVGDIEIWEIYNFTVDAHPIHVHMVQFEVINRQELAREDSGGIELPAQPEGPIIPPAPWETGFKDTVIAYPGQVTRIKALFDIAGRYVWHCHIVEHEDNEMMRPYEVVPPQ